MGGLWYNYVEAQSQDACVSSISRYAISRHVCKLDFKTLGDGLSLMLMLIKISCEEREHVYKEARFGSVSWCSRALGDGRRKRDDYRYANHRRCHLRSDWC